MINNTIFIFLGPPGSGKGTLSARCVQEFGWLQLSTGDLCRDHVANGTDLGKKIKDFTEKGFLVPDEIIADMVADWLVGQSELPEGVIFDGYPRTKVQAAILYDLLQTRLNAFDIVLIKVAVDSELLTLRIVNRVICSNKNCGRVYSLTGSNVTQETKSMICGACGASLIRRADDTEESLQQRLKIYYQHEQEIIDFFVDKGLSIAMLNGMQSPQEVFNDFKKIVLCDHDC